MVKVVGPESGTVAAPPERVFSLKLPSGLVTSHVSTPFVFQNIEVRAPRDTRSGTAQMSTSGFAFDICTEGEALDDDEPALACWTTTGCEGVCGTPTW